jgi:hypothetical protein
MARRRSSQTLALYLTLALAPLLADAGSLPEVSSGARPGPDVLYAPAPAAPPLENRHPRFQAAPLRVSGHEAYVAGEYLYQDWLYDDYGSDSDGTGAAPLSPRVGDAEYPTNRARYGNNAADLVELRIDVAQDSVAYRVTLNTLLEPDTTIVTLAFDTDRNAATGAAILPRDPGAPFPGTDEVITIWGTGAEHSALPTLGSPVTTALSDLTTDLEANQLTVIVPRTVSNPSGLWRATIATGLYDAATGGWLRPQQQATATRPGGAGTLDPTPSGIFNLGFRFDETFYACPPPPAALSCDVPPDTDQSAALRSKTPTAYAHDIDFAKLDAGVTESTVPATGLQVRLFPSRLPLGEGRGTLGTAPGENGVFPQYLGQLQPYSLYVPSTYTPGTPAGLTLNLHSLGEHYWQYHGATMVQQLGEQRGNLVATSLSRGPDGWYQHEAEYDVFEMWNDVATHFTLDPERVVSSGYSMGGYATYRLGTLYPDLFGAAFTQVGPPGDGIWLPPGAPTGGLETLTNLWLENARNVPYLNVVASADELVPLVGPRAQNLGAPEHGIRGFDQLGYRFRFLIFSPSDHFAQAAAGYDYPFAAAFLGDGHVDRNPPHVTFAYVPAADDPDLGLVHDHAYWVSEVRLADPEGGEAPGKGVVDVLSHGFGVGDPPSTAGTTAGAVPPFTYTEFNRTWGAAPAIPVANVADLTLTNVGSLRIDLARAALHPWRTLTIHATSDGAALLHLDGAFADGGAVLEDGVPLAGATVGPGGAAIPVAAGTHTYTIAEPFDVRRLGITLKDGSNDRLVLRARLTALLAELGLPGQDVSISVVGAAGPLLSATVPAAALVPNARGSKVSFRDPTGTVAGGITRLVVGGTRRTDITMKAAGLDLSTAAPGPMTVTLTIGDRTFVATGALRARGSAKLVYP